MMKFNKSLTDADFWNTFKCKFPSIFNIEMNMYLIIEFYELINMFPPSTSDT